jgi:hypothetical protein
LKSSPCEQPLVFDCSICGKSGWQSSVERPCLVIGMLYSQRGYECRSNISRFTHDSTRAVRSIRDGRYGHRTCKRSGLVILSGSASFSNGKGRWRSRHCYNLPRSGRHSGWRDHRLCRVATLDFSAAYGNVDTQDMDFHFGWLGGGPRCSVLFNI